MTPTTVHFPIYCQFPTYNLSDIGIRVLLGMNLPPPLVWCHKQHKCKKWCFTQTAHPHKPDWSSHPSRLVDCQKPLRCSSQRSFFGGGASKKYCLPPPTPSSLSYLHKVHAYIQPWFRALRLCKVSLPVSACCVVIRRVDRWRPGLFLGRPGPVGSPACCSVQIVSTHPCPSVINSPTAPVFMHYCITLQYAAYEWSVSIIFDV